MNEERFRSSLAAWFEGFCTLKRASGYDYRGQEGILCRFDRYLALGDREPDEVDARVLGDYLALGAHLAPRTRKNIVSVLWPALKYARRHGAQCPPLPLRPSFSRVTSRIPVILNDEEIHRLLVAARKLESIDPLRPYTYATLFGLLATTGMRVGEAQKLQLRDVDLAGRVLMVREGKFHKSRLLPIHESTAEALARYISRRREAGMTRASEAPLLVNLKGRPLVYENIRQTFSRLCKSAALDCPLHGVPRIHDLRHSFAVRRVIAWYRAGIDVNTRLSALSTYLGHVSVEKTLVYLRPHQEMLSEAAHRFEASCAPPLNFPKEES